MRIIEKGFLPDHEVFAATCQYCKTKFEFYRHEASHKMDRNESYLSIRCPTCSKNVTVAQ